jgi:hypothetical protein
MRQLCLPQCLCVSDLSYFALFLQQLLLDIVVADISMFIFTTIDCNKENIEGRIPSNIVIKNIFFFSKFKLSVKFLAVVRRT